MMAANSPESLDDILRIQRESFMQDGEASIQTRIDRVERCVDFLIDNQDAIVEATKKDWIHKPDSFIKAVEIIPVINHAKSIKKNLKNWMKDEVRKPDFPFNLMGAKTYIKYQALGVVGVMVPWNGPLAMAIVASMDAFCAGNRVMVKVSEFSPRAADLLATKLPEYFDVSELAIVTGEVEVSRAFAELPFNHLMYTGSAGTAKHIMAAAARNLVPVTLELGGKSPVIIGAGADIAYTASRTMSGRLINSGQGCITPDYVLLPDAQLDEFIEQAKAAVTKMYPLDKAAADYASIATDAHYKRMHELIADAQAKSCNIITVDVGATDARRQFTPAIVVNPPEDSRLMQEEIFGPILVIKTYKTFQDAVDYVNKGECPLALYFFGDNEQEKATILSQTSSGGLAINEVMMQLMMSDLPFGGVGHSGMGSYWGGGAGFKRFSHAKSVFEQGWYKKLGAMMDPPYGNTIDKMLKMQLKKTR